jgi:hypothetical protein
MSENMGGKLLLVSFQPTQAKLNSLAVQKLFTLMVITKESAIKNLKLQTDHVSMLSDSAFASVLMKSSRKERSMRKLSAWGFEQSNS